MIEPYVIPEENAIKIANWLQTRGGVAIWRSVNLSNPGACFSTPALKEDGAPTTKPSWEVANTPERIITDMSEVVVVQDVEVRRFHVAVRVSSNGLMLKVTDGGSRRIWSAVAKAGDGAFHRFDYFSQEAVIFKPTNPIPLNVWLKSNNGGNNNGSEASA